MLGPGHPAGQMAMEVGMISAILRFGTVADAIEEYGFEAIEIRAREVRADVDDDAGELLAHGAPHDSSFAETDGEAFFGRDGGNVSDKFSRLLG